MINARDIDFLINLCQKEIDDLEAQRVGDGEWPEGWDGSDFIHVQNEIWFSIQRLEAMKEE